VGIVPAVVPRLSACLSLVLVAVGSRERWAGSAPVSALIGLVVVVTSWAIAMLPFDVLRIVRLVPLPLSTGGFTLRVLLLIAAAGALVPILVIGRACPERCPACRRTLPGQLDRLPRWPAVVAVVFALPYPALWVHWAIGRDVRHDGRAARCRAHGRPHPAGASRPSA
jgi:hypothetical protein